VKRRVSFLAAALGLAACQSTTPAASRFDAAQLGRYLDVGHKAQRFERGRYNFLLTPDHIQEAQDCKDKVVAGARFPDASNHLGVMRTEIDPVLERLATQINRCLASTGSSVYVFPHPLPTLTLIR
jgi:hypothetical protein